MGRVGIGEIGRPRDGLQKEARAISTTATVLDTAGAFALRMRAGAAAGAEG